jgi:DNA polymerase-3 subunit epsilon
MAAAETTLPKDLVFVDLETTGGNPAHHRITEIGIVRVAQGETAEEWSSLVNPGCPIPAYIQAFTGISDQMVAGAPPFADVAALVRQKLQGAVFVAHNARFDYSFLRGEFRRLALPFSAKVLCTVKLSRRLFPEHVRHNLDAVMERHGLTCSARHRALGDAQVLRDFWFKLQGEVPEAALRAAAQSLLGAYKLPAHLPPDIADDLPEGPGAYRYFGEDDALLYVGKSRSLRSRVLAQLADGADAGERRLASLVRRVDWVETAGELGATLLEAEWIKTQRPPRNSRRKNRSQQTLRFSTERSGLAGRSAFPERVEPVAIAGIEAADLSQSFGLFHSEKDALKALMDIARARQLCLRVLGLEEGEGSCFAHQVGKCRGACVGKEPLILHQTRVRLALSSLKLKSWPFPGRIGLRERDAPAGEFLDTRRVDLHVFDHWTYLGSARSDEELAALRAQPAGAGFDVDVYRILVRYFSNHPKLDWMDLRSEPSRDDQDPNWELP